LNKYTLALQDFFDALLHYRIWWQLAWVEVKQRYRRSVLGPWWISISMLIFIIAMGAVFSRLFKESLADYVPFFTSGFLTWMFISTGITEGALIFKESESFIKQVRLPFNLYIFKHLTRHGIYLAHNFVVYILVMLYFRENPGWTALWAIPGFILLFINMYWICLLVTLLSTRYRDTIPMISSFVQIAFFVTPISWMPKLMGAHSWILKVNPLVYFLGAIRNPLTGAHVTLHTWLFNIGFACIGLFVTFIVFAYSRSRIAFWVD